MSTERQEETGEKDTVDTWWHGTWDLGGDELALPIDLDQWRTVAGGWSGWTCAKNC